MPARSMRTGSASFFASAFASAGFAAFASLPSFAPAASFGLSPSSFFASFASAPDSSSLCGGTGVSRLSRSVSA